MNSTPLFTSRISVQTSARLSASQQRGRKSLYEYLLGKHILDLFADPHRCCRSRSGWSSLVAMNAVCIKRNSSGNRKTAPSAICLLLFRTMKDVVKEQGYQRKAAGPSGLCSKFILEFFVSNHALGASCFPSCECSVSSQSRKAPAKTER